MKHSETYSAPHGQNYTGEKILRGMLTHNIQGQTVLVPREPNWGHLICYLQKKWIINQKDYVSRINSITHIHKTDLFIAKNMIKY